MIKFQANKLNLSNEQISIRIKTGLKCYFNNLKSNKVSTFITEELLHF